MQLTMQQNDQSSLSVKASTVNNNRSFMNSPKWKVESRQTT